MKTTPALLALLLAAAFGTGGYLIGARSGRGATQSGAVPDAPASAATAAKPAARRILYYRNPMGLPDTSAVPKKDPMGMDYIPVYEGEESAEADSGGASTLKISTEKIQKLGVRTEAVARRALGRSVRAAGRVEPDERRIAMISPKFEGYVERLLVNATGAPVAKGEALLEAYSPEMVSAQREYVIAMQGMQALRDGSGEAAGGMKQLAESALARLRNWDLSADELAALVRTGEPKRTITLRSPAAGIVTEKKAFQGMRFMAGEALYQVTDLGAVWVVADVAEQDIAAVRLGAKARISLQAYPDQAFDGRITYVYPTLKAETRTVPVRIELANPGGRLKPAMFAQVELQVGAGAPVLAVPESAVIDSGRRQLVIVQRGEGRFEPREVRLGERGDAYIAVLDGLKEGEPVVVTANFLIDAESNLKAAVSGFASATPASAPAAAASAAVGHTGTGRIESVEGATVTMAHEPIASLKWPAMTMEFKLANPSLAKGLEPGLRLSFEIVQRQPGEWVITKWSPAAGTGAAAPASGPRKN